MNMTKNILTFSQKLQLHAMLEENIVVMENGVCHYKEAAMDDNWITKQLQFPCTVANVRSLRQEIFGSLMRGGSNKKTDADLVSRVYRLETVIIEILRVAAAMREKSSTLRDFYEEMTELQFGTWSNASGDK